MTVGIVSYGAYIPRYRIKVSEIAKVWGADVQSIIGGLRVQEKSVPDMDEDTATIAVESARNAIKESRPVWVSSNPAGSISGLPSALMSHRARPGMRSNTPLPQAGLHTSSAGIRISWSQRSRARSRLPRIQLDTKPDDYDYAVFHQPNGKFPRRVAASLGFTSEQIDPGIAVTTLGNTYSASCMIGLAAILDIASAGDRIFMAEYF